MASLTLGHLKAAFAYMPYSVVVLSPSSRANLCTMVTLLTPVKMSLACTGAQAEWGPAGSLTLKFESSS